jgi:hypothetical protein
MGGYFGPPTGRLWIGRIANGRRSAYTKATSRIPELVGSCRSALGWWRDLSTFRYSVSSERGWKLALTRHEWRLLEIEAARVRHHWTKSQIKSDGATPALLKYLRKSLDELAALRAAYECGEETHGIRVKIYFR